MHHDEIEIARDYELSERLGAEILAAGCTPVEAETVTRKLTCLRPARRVNLVTGEVVEYWEEF
jgi:hypothetical protein